MLFFFLTAAAKEIVAEALPWIDLGEDPDDGVPTLHVDPRANWLYFGITQLWDAFDRMKDVYTGIMEQKSNENNSNNGNNLNNGNKSKNGNKSNSADNSGFGNNSNGADASISSLPPKVTNSDDILDDIISHEANGATNGNRPQINVCTVFLFFACIYKATFLILRLFTYLYVFFIFFCLFVCTKNRI